MKLDKNRVYTALNADELKIGSKVIVADSLDGLRCGLEHNDYEKIREIREDDYASRFEIESGVGFTLAYLVEEPQLGLKWQDLKIGDIIRNKNNGLVYMITGVDAREVDNHGNANKHIAGNGNWLTDDELTYWELA